MYTEISFDKLNREISEMLSCENKLKRQAEELGETEQRLKHIESGSLELVLKSLRQQRENLYGEIRNIQILRRTLQKILRLYQNTENGLLDYEEQPEFSASVNMDLMNLRYLTGILSQCGITFQ